MSKKKSQVQIAKDMADGLITPSNEKLPVYKLELDEEVKQHDLSVSMVNKPDSGVEWGQRQEPTPFTIKEAIEHYKGNPTVMCLADDTALQMDSNTIHSTEHTPFKEPWIWAYSKEEPNDFPLNILLYAPGKLSSDYFKAPILDS